MDPNDCHWITSLVLLIFHKHIVSPQLLSPMRVISWTSCFSNWDISSPATIEGDPPKFFFLIRLHLFTSLTIYAGDLYHLDSLTCYCRWLQSSSPTLPLLCISWPFVPCAGGSHAPERPHTQTHTHTLHVSCHFHKILRIALFGFIIPQWTTNTQCHYIHETKELSLFVDTQFAIVIKFIFNNLAKHITQQCPAVNVTKTHYV